MGNRWRHRRPVPVATGPDERRLPGQRRLSVLTQNGTAVAEQVLVEDWCQEFPSHSIGSIGFGPDGMLYAGGGDGASFNYADYGQDAFPSSTHPDNPCGDPPSPTGTALGTAVGRRRRVAGTGPPDTAATPRPFDGSIIRINPNTGLAAPSNPLLSSSDLNARRIVANGLRNPMRFDFRPGTNELWVGDVGWSAWEEINRIVSPTAGVTNFGWPCYEGANRQSGYDANDLSICENLYAAGPSAVASPYYAYHHSESGGR